jgi:lipoprotein NlpI
MKKVFALLFVAGVMTLAACSKKAEETTVETPAVDTTATVAVDSTMATDSTAMPADSAK